MQRLSGLLLVLAGTSLGAYSYLPPAPDAQEKLAEVTRISAAPDRDTRSTQTPGRSFSPAAPLTGTAQPAKNAAAPVAVAAVESKKAAEVPAAAPIKPWSTVVTADTQTQGRLTSSKPGDDATRMQLTRDLQRELQRVGCYGGEITGSWTPSTKRAMSAFMDRVNATLPIEEPDYILLTLVQGQTSTACGASCPSGQGLSNEGRCVPQAVIAQASRKSQREEQRRVAALEEQQRKADDRRASEERKVAEERKAADERKVAEARAKADADRDRIIASRVATERAAQEAKRQTVAAAQPVEELPWAKQNAAPLAATASERPVPPPGMMAIGGPRRETPETPKSVIALNTDASSQLEDSVKEPSAAPVLTPPAPVPATRPQAKLPVQGLAGTKSGPTVRHRPAEPAPYISKSQRQRLPQQYVRRPPPPPPYAVFKAPKPKVYYYASNNSVRAHHRDPSRLAPSHYNMMQSLGGFY